jgi:hypothetical protein
MPNKIRAPRLESLLDSEVSVLKWMVECGKLEEKLLPSEELLEAVKEESAGFLSDASG